MKKLQLDLKKLRGTPKSTSRPKAKPKAKPKPKPKPKPIDPGQPLTNIRYERFCWEFIRHNSNRTKAAIAAGFCPGNAHKMGWQLAARDDVRARIAYVTNEALRELHVDASRTLAEIGRLAFLDMKDVVQRAETKLVQQGTNKDGEPVYEYTPVIMLQDWDEIDGTLIKEIGVRAGNIYVRVHDRTDYVRMLAQYHDLIRGGARKLDDPLDGEEGDGDGDNRAQMAFIQIVLNQYRQAAQTDEERAAVAKVAQLIQNKEVMPLAE